MGFLDIDAASVVQLRAWLVSRDLTCLQLVQYYLDKIEKFDGELNAVIELNPAALEIAAECDEKIESTGLIDVGPLFGIPVLIKDNIDTADQMKTTAGSLALLDAPVPKEDAHIVSNLRSNGAIILGKTNMSEWAFARCLNEGISGWSARGGLTKNPYDLNRTPSGSSSGSAVAVAAGFAPLAVGTETEGSILSPSSACSIVGIKPTVGLVSRSGIIPISSRQDTAGPMAKTVSDAAALLTVLSGEDESDAANKANPLTEVDFSSFLDESALDGSRIAVIDFLVHPHEESVVQLFEAAVEDLNDAGATVLRSEIEVNKEQLWTAEGVALQTEFRHELNQYLEQRNSDTVRNIDDLIEFNIRNADTEMSYFGQSYLEETSQRGSLDGQDYLAALETCERLAKVEFLDKIFEGSNVEAAIVPVLGVPGVLDMSRGDAPNVSSTFLAAIAGYPSIAVPAGYVDGLGVGISFIGKKWSESKLIALAYSYEQRTKHRKAPLIVS